MGVTYLEFHIHTKAGSADSSIRVDDLGQLAASSETGGLVVSEHFRVWTDWEREAFFARWGVRLYRAVEHTTRQGHVIVIGAEPGVKMPDETSALVEFARDQGWYTILAHPFRHYYDKIHGSQTPPFPLGEKADVLAEAPIFRGVDAVEIENADCTDPENQLAAEVASILSLPVTVGSDAHHVDDFGRRRLPVSAIPQNEHELVDLVNSFRLESFQFERNEAGHVT